MKDHLTSPITPCYNPPNEVPFYWKEEPTGALAEAIETYLALTQGQKYPAEQFALLKEYLVYWVKAPRWLYNCIVTHKKDQLAALKGTLEQAETVEQIRTWVEQCNTLLAYPWAKQYYPWK